MDKVLIDKHISFFKCHLFELPTEYESNSNNRLMFYFFALSGLDLLDKIDDLTLEEKKGICDYVYSCQVTTIDDKDGEELASFTGESFKFNDIKNQFTTLKSGEVAMIFVATLMLVLLKDDMNRLNKNGIKNMILKCQLPSGCFAVSPYVKDTDMRFCYCAVVVCVLLGFLELIDLEKLIEYIMKSHNYDGGFSQSPGLESHAGSTFCAVASLVLIQNHSAKYGGAAKTYIDGFYRKTLRWCVKLAHSKGGYCGRPGKLPDSCYSFWNGAPINILSKIDSISEPLVKTEFIKYFNLLLQNRKVGGIAKAFNCAPDIMHSYLGMCGLSLTGAQDDIKLLDPLYMISVDSSHAFINKTP